MNPGSGHRWVEEPEGQPWDVAVMNFIDNVGMPKRGDVAQVIDADDDGASESELEPEGLSPEVYAEGAPDEPDEWDERVLPDGVRVEEIDWSP